MGWGGSSNWYCVFRFTVSTVGMIGTLLVGCSAASGGTVHMVIVPCRVGIMMTIGSVIGGCVSRVIHEHPGMLLHVASWQHSAEGILGDRMESTAQVVSE